MTHSKRKQSCMTSRTTLMLMMAMLVWGATITTALPAENCLSATGESAVAACRRELSHDPGNVDIRFALADAFMSLRRYEDAVAVLREGFEHFPGDDRIKKKLTLAESYLEEQQWIEKQKERSDDSSRSKKKETQVRLSIIRCNKLKGDAAMAACNDGLKVIPDHPELLTGRGIVWLDRSRFGNAILDFQEAAAVLTPRSEKVPAPKIQESSPTTTSKIGTSTVQSIAPTKRKTPSKPVAPEASPINTMIAESEPPIETSPAKTIDRPVFNEPVVETTQQTKPLEIAANQPHQYSNLPEVPGITH